jgi:hypothetical protein
MPVWKLSALVLVAVALAGCSAGTRPATNVTSDSATLHGDVPCPAKVQGKLWWELREVGESRWQAKAARSFTCGAEQSLQVSSTVAGLRAGVGYVYRLAADPLPAGGPVVYSSTRSLTTDRFDPGLVSSADHGLSAQAAGTVGADVVRLEFDIGTRVADMRASIDTIADRGARPLLLAGFHGRMPTESEARNLGSWASEFGPGGTFWAGRPDRDLSVQQIEFGNETSYSHQYGDSWSDPSYASRARLYATRFAQATVAVAATGRDVGLLAQADDGGSGSSVWVDGMFAAVPNLGNLVDGWTVHPYGPRERWKPKLDRLVAQTAARGAPATIPIDVTEYGLSSSNGSALSDNYGWPVNLTYAQAAAALDGTVASMLADPAIGKRLRLFMIYAAHDLRPPGTTSDREASFGVLQNDLDPKGAYSNEVREQLAR